MIHLQHPLDPAAELDLAAPAAPAEQPLVFTRRPPYPFADRPSCNLGVEAGPVGETPVDAAPSPAAVDGPTSAAALSGSVAAADVIAPPSERAPVPAGAIGQQEFPSASSSRQAIGGQESPPPAPSLHPSFDPTPGQTGAGDPLQVSMGGPPASFSEFDDWLSAFPASSSGAVGRSIVPVLACRVEQVQRWGHTPEKDAERPLREFLLALRDGAQAALEDLQFFPQEPDRIERRLVKHAALALATLDRLKAGQ